MMKRWEAMGAGAAILAASWALRPVGAQENAAAPEFYTQRIKPVLQTNCYRCHGGMNRRGGLSMETRDGMLKGGHDGSAIVPGDPANSQLVKRIRHEDPLKDPMPMPPYGKLSDAQIALIEQWIKAGAPMPDSAAK